VWAVASNKWDDTAMEDERVFFKPFIVVYRDNGAWEKEANSSLSEPGFLRKWLRLVKSFCLRC
jgi:hypothetical protein